MEHRFINYLPGNESMCFRGSDEEKFFRKNLKRQDKNWIYRNKEIKYSYNEFGFRTRPFNDIDWKESVVVFGCSNIEGLGLAEEDTLVMQLEKIIERPVINLGIGGAGVDLACWNSLILHETVPTPKAIIQMWSSLDRYADYKYNTLLTLLPNGRNYYPLLNWSFRSKKYIESDRVLWRNKTTYVEGTFFWTSDTPLNELNVKQFVPVDKARDLMHPGIESNRLAAEYFAEQLKSQI